MSNDNTANKNKIKEQMESYNTFERYEIIHGVRYDFQPSPSIIHQIILTNINQSINQTCQQEGIVIVAPMDVHLDHDNTVQPDVIFIRNDNLDIIRNQRIEGTPDLLVEILSPSTGKHDRSRKKSLYESFKVKEYWIVDPSHYTIEQFVLQNNAYILHAVYGEGDLISSNLMICININVDQLFETAKQFID